MLLRNIDAPAAAFAHPNDVPSSVDDTVLAAALRAGRPDGAPGLLTVRGIGCPTIAAGSGRPVLCVHGLGHDAWDFGPFFVRCSNRASLLAFDLPGFGLADKPAAHAYGLDLYVEALLQAAALSPEPPVVVASSLGGHLALLAALEKPSAFAKLVLVAPGGLVDVPAPMQALLRAYYSVESLEGRIDAEIVGNSRRIFAPGASAAHPAIAAVDDALAARKLAVHHSARRREFAVPFAGVVGDVFGHVVMKHLSQIRTPTLIIVGERDVVVPPDACATAARNMSARFLSFANVGHTPHLEAPDAFADAVLTFIHGATS